MTHPCSRPRTVRVPVPHVEIKISRPHDEIARIAYSYWDARGRQGGSAEEDWYRAEREWDRQNGRV